MKAEDRCLTYMIMSAVVVIVLAVIVGTFIGEYFEKARRGELESPNQRVEEQLKTVGCGWDERNLCVCIGTGGAYGSFAFVAPPDACSLER